MWSLGGVSEEHEDDKVRSQKRAGDENMVLIWENYI